MTMIQTSIAEAPPETPWQLLAILCLFVLMLALPFLPGARELFWPEDDGCLAVNSDHVRDPRYFETSFKNKLLQAIGPWPDESTEANITLSKTEQIQVTTGDLTIGHGKKVDTLAYVGGRLTTENETSLNKEVYATGNVFVGPSSNIRALASDRDITISAQCSVVRWLGTPENIFVGPNCQLGVSVACAGRLQLEGDCSFNDLFGHPIATGTPDHDPAPATRAQTPRLVVRHDGQLKGGRHQLIIPARTMFQGDIVSEKNVIVGEGAVIEGTIKTRHTIELGAHCLVTGNLLAGGPITIGQATTISQNVFSQSTITSLPGVTVGRVGATKSMVAREGILLRRGNLIYGHVKAYGNGKVS